MPYKYNALTGEFNIVQSPGSGVAVIEIDTDSGNAFPNMAGVINLVGGAGVQTSASGNTITITATATTPLSFPTDSGIATPAANTLTIAGGIGLNTSGAGSTVTVHLDIPVTVPNGGTGAITFTANSLLLGNGASPISSLGAATDGQLPIGRTGNSPVLALPISSDGSITVTGGAGTLDLVVAGGATVGKTITGDLGPALVPTSGNWNIVGTAAQGISSSGAGSTLTFTIADASTVQKGVSELATDAEAIAGTDSVRTIVPTSLKAKLGTQTANGVPYGTGDTNAIAWTAALTNGQLLIGRTGNTPLAATLTAGANIAITNGAGSITIAATGAASFSWTTATGDTTMAVNTGYIANKAGTACVLTLPATAAVGDIIRVSGKGATGWQVAQNGGQAIHFGALNTTTGAGGSLSSTAQYDCVEILCITANTDFEVLSSIGNITVV